MISQGQVVTGVLAGSLAGAVAGILFAPRRGKVIRRFVRFKAYKLRQKKVENVT